MKLISEAQLADVLPVRGRVFIHGAAATPQVLIDALVANAAQCEALELMHLHTMGEAVYCRPEYARAFRVSNFFVGANVRPFLDYERVDYLPCFLSAIPALLAREKKPDACLISVSPPNAEGLYSLGTSVDVALTAVREAPLVIAQINRQLPFTHGAGRISAAQISYAVEVDRALPEASPERLGLIEQQIGQHVAALVEDGATLQVGIGSIPNAVLLALKNHRDLGVHTEMFADGLLPLVNAGAVNNSRKHFYPGRIVSSFVSGTRRLFDFVHQNPSVVFLGSDIVNDPAVIASNPGAVAINSAVEVDLSGQVCADSIGPKVISGFGGQLDFIRGAAASPGGKAIIALPSRTKHGKPRIVARLQSGAGVVTTRGDVDYLVTEYGAVQLRGKSMGERAQALINIAHPDDREALARSWHEAR